MYLESVQEFGFDHIIVIGKKPNYGGILFLDCYERVFTWDMMTDMLFPQGNSLKEASSARWGRPWIVDDDGSIIKQINYCT